MSTADRNASSASTPSYDFTTYNDYDDMPQTAKVQALPHLIAAIATDPDNVHPLWWLELCQRKHADLHHLRAQAIAHIDPNIAEKKIARWCAKTIEKGVASIQVSPALFDNSPFDLLPPPTNSHIDQETIRTVAQSIAHQFTRYAGERYSAYSDLFNYKVDHRAYQWLHAALQRNATTPLVGEVHKKIFETLHDSKWWWKNIDDSHSQNGYQNRDHLCFFFGSTKAAIDFLQRVRLKNQTKRDFRDRLCQILAKEHHDPAPYDTPPMPQVPNNENRQLWEKIWNILHHTHHQQIEIGWFRVELEKHFTSFTRHDLMPSTIDTLRTFAARASPHAQRTLAEYIFSSLEESETELRKDLLVLDTVLEPLESHDPRSVPAVCYAALVGRFLEQDKEPEPKLVWEKILPEILTSCQYKKLPSRKLPSRSLLAAAWVLARAAYAQKMIHLEERQRMAHVFVESFTLEHLPSFSQAWKKICPLQEQQQHLLQHPAALLMPTPEKDESGYYRYKKMSGQAKNIVSQDPIAAVSVLVALPADALPRDSTPVLELIARNDRARKAFTEHFGHETLCGALTTMLLNAENERQRQDAAQALTYLSQENRP